eukprot:3880513-Amphidinium_carterae.1
MDIAITETEFDLQQCRSPSGKLAQSAVHICEMAGDARDMKGTEGQLLRTNLVVKNTLLDIL